MKEFRLTTKVENGMPVEKWVSGYFVEEDQIADALRSLAAFNKLDKIMLGIIADMCKVKVDSIEKICKKYGITYFTE